eukprot:403373711
MRSSIFRPKSSYLGNPERQINYESKVFTTDVIAIDKHLDNVEEIIVKFNNRPRSTEKIQKIGIDLNEKYKQMQRLQEQMKLQKDLNDQTAIAVGLMQNEYISQVSEQQNHQFLVSRNQQQYLSENFHSPKNLNSKMIDMKCMSTNQASVKKYDSQFLLTQQKLANQHRLQSASTKYTLNNPKTSINQSAVTGSTRKMRIESAKTIGSPMSRNFIQSSALMSQKSGSIAPPQVQKTKKAKEQKKLQYSQSQMNLQQVQEYQQFFQKNANIDYGIAQYVMTGNKIDTQKNKKIKAQIQKVGQTTFMENIGAEAQIQTEEADTLNESDFVFLDQEDDQAEPLIQYSPKVESNLLYQGQHVKIYKPVKDVQKRGRPQTAGPSNLVKRRFQQSQQKVNNYSKDQSPINLEQIDSDLENLQEQLQIQKSELQQPIINKVDYSKLESTFRNEHSLQKSIFRDKKQKIVELTEYLKLILHDYQLQNFKNNQDEIDQTISKFNLSYQLNENQNIASLLNSKRTGNTSNHEKLELQKSIEDSQIQSTGLRLRRLTAKYGPKVDLVSHGFQKFRVQDIEQFFDPLRLKLMMVPLSDIPNQFTKQGSDFHFIKGIKLQLMKELQAALNSYEEGILQYPQSSFNCKFNKGVILFKLGMFKEALRIYQQIVREEPLDKRIAYNKSLCEIQIGLYSQAIFTIDSYVNNFKERKQRYDHSSKTDNSLSYQEKIQMTKSNYVPDDQYLFEIYQIRGVACLRANKVVEASKSFQVAQEFKQHIFKKQGRQDSSLSPNRINSNNILIQNQGIDIEKSSSVNNVLDEDGYTIITLEQTQNGSLSKRSQSINKNITTGGIRCEDQAENEGQFSKQQMNIRIRPLTAKLQKSQSQQVLQGQMNQFHLRQRLETLEEENDNYLNIKSQSINDQNNNNFISGTETPINLPDQQEDLFSLDAEDILRTLDQYDQEHKQITNEVMSLREKNLKFKTQKIDVKSYQTDVHNTLNVNRNIDQYLDEDRIKKESPKKHGVATIKRSASSDLRITGLRKKSKNNYYFSNNNLLINIEKPQGAIAQFITYQKDQTLKVQQEKEFKQKLQSFELENIQSKLSTKRREKEIENITNSQNSAIKNKNVQEIEENILMRPEDFYIDTKRQIRLDKVLLGFEIDPFNDSITEQEIEVRQRREQLEQEFSQPASEDPFYKRLEDQKRENEAMKNKEYFLQFLQVSDKDLLGLPEHHMAIDGIKELTNLQKQIGGIRKYIDQTFADPQKTALNLDKNLAMAQHLNSLLESTQGGGQGVNMSQSSKLLESLSTTQISNQNTLDSVGDPFSKHSQQPQITKRFNLDQIKQIIDQYSVPQNERNIQILGQILNPLKFFIKFPHSVRSQLYQLATLETYSKDQVIFNQGDNSEDFYVILKGSVCVRTVKEELGNVPVNTRVCYDGDYIGEIAHFEPTDSLTPEIIADLHRQRVTTTALENPTILLKLNKKAAQLIINSPALQKKYEKRINFLRQLDIFKDIDMYILLPLASNIKVKKFKMGEIIVKAGELPEGLIIVKEGECLVCAEKLAMRSNQASDYTRLHPKNQNIKTNPTGSSHMIYDKSALKSGNSKRLQIKSVTSESGNQVGQNSQKYYSDSLQQVNTHHKTYQNEQILVDDKGRRMKDFTVYKDLMVFFTLLPKAYFGGRVLLPVQNKKETDDERRNKPSVSEGPKRRGAWFAGGQQLKHSSTNIDNQVKQVLGDFEHLFIKRRYSMTTQKIMKNERSSMLSVIANSASVEVYLIDQQLLDFFPEHTQKMFWNKLMHVFEPDRPYMLKNVQKIKDKFREWDVYKIKSYQDRMKSNWDQRKGLQQKQVVQLDR